MTALSDADGVTRGVAGGLRYTLAVCPSASLSVRLTLDLVRACAPAYPHLLRCCRSGDLEREHVSPFVAGFQPPHHDPAQLQVQEPVFLQEFRSAIPAPRRLQEGHAAVLWHMSLSQKAVGSRWGMRKSAALTRTGMSVRSRKGLCKG